MFLSETYSGEEVYVQTTYKQRTIDSAIALMDGLYGESLTWPTEYGMYSLNTVPEELD